MSYERFEFGPPEVLSVRDGLRKTRFQVFDWEGNLLDTVVSQRPATEPLEDPDDIATQLRLISLMRADPHSPVGQSFNRAADNNPDVAVLLRAIREYEAAIERARRLTPVEGLNRAQRRARQRAAKKKNAPQMVGLQGAAGHGKGHPDCTDPAQQRQPQRGDGSAA